MPERREQHLLLGHIEDDLNEIEQRDVARLLKQDPKLAMMVEGIEADKELLESLPDPPPPSWLMDEVDRHLERAMLVDVAPFESQNVAQRQRHILHRIMVGGSIAAMVGIVASIIYFSVSDMDAGSTIASLLKSNQKENKSKVASSSDVQSDAASDTSSVEVATAAPMASGQDNTLGDADVMVDANSKSADVTAGNAAPAATTLDSAPVAETTVDSTVAEKTKAPAADPSPVLTLTTPAVVSTDTPPNALSSTGLTSATSPGPMPSLVAGAEQAAAEAAPELFARHTVVDANLLTPDTQSKRFQSAISDVLSSVVNQTDKDAEAIAAPETIVPPSASPLAAQLADQIAELQAKLQTQQRLDNHIQAISQDPTRAKDFELRIVSPDLIAVRTLLTQVAKAASGDDSATPLVSPSATPSRFMDVHLPAGSLAGVIGELKSHQAVEDIELVEREVFALGQLPGRAKAMPSQETQDDAKPVGPWPSMAPDYSLILLGQLPTEANGLPSPSQAAANDLIELAVMIVKPISTEPPEAPPEASPETPSGQSQKSTRTVENAKITPPLLPTRAPVLKLRSAPAPVLAPNTNDPPAEGADGNTPDASSPSPPVSPTPVPTPAPTPRLDLKNRSLIDSSPFEKIPTPAPTPAPAPDSESTPDSPPQSTPDQ